jgi:acetylornithine deacetylase
MGTETVNRQETLELLGKLISIDSVNPDLVEGAAGEKEIAEYIHAYMKHIGLDVRFQKTARDNRPNVIGILRGSGGGRTLLLNGHMDTVGVVGMKQPFLGELRDGKVYGRGAYDMKGALAAMLIAAKRIKETQTRLRGDLILTTVVDEEYASIGTEEVVKEYRADGALLLEATDLKICVAHKGFAWVDVETSGKAAHGSRPDLGIDAIVNMGRFLVELDALENELENGRKHPLLGTGSVHASLIQGGRELSTYPDHCLLQLERRTVPAETRERVSEEIQSIINKLRSDDTFDASFRVTFYRNAWEADENSQVIKAVSDCIFNRTGRRSEKMVEPGWMDSAILQRAGIPCAIFGPGGFDAHGVNEYVDLGQVVECANILVDVIKTFCS